jgi:cinnamyl-alcohol dehydrogenase
MRYYGMTEPGKRLAVVGLGGLGGLGHMAVKFGVAFGLHVTVVSTSPAKEAEAKQVLGAHRFLLSSDPHAMRVTCISINHLFEIGLGFRV